MGVLTDGSTRVSLRCGAAQEPAASFLTLIPGAAVWRDASRARKTPYLEVTA